MQCWLKCSGFREELGRLEVSWQWRETSCHRWFGPISEAFSTYHVSFVCIEVDSSSVCKGKGKWTEQKDLRFSSFCDSSSLSVSLAPTESNAPLAIGLTAAGTSLLTLASFLLWLLKRLRKRGKGAWKHTPKMFLKHVFIFLIDESCSVLHM